MRACTCKAPAHLEEEARVSRVLDLAPHGLEPRQGLDEVAVHKHLGLPLVGAVGRRRGVRHARHDPVVQLARPAGGLGGSRLREQPALAVHGLGVGPQLLGVRPVERHDAKVARERRVGPRRGVPRHGDRRAAQIVGRRPRWVGERQEGARWAAGQPRDQAHLQQRDRDPVVWHDTREIDDDMREVIDDTRD